MGDLQRLIAFDLDGTLIDSRRDLAESANQVITELGGRPLPEDAIGRMVGEGAAVLVKRALAAAGLGDVPGGLPRFLEIYDGRLTNHTRAYEGIEDAVDAARRVARVIVLTNKPAGPSERILGCPWPAGAVRRGDWRRRAVPAETRSGVAICRDGARSGRLRRTRC